MPCWPARAGILSHLFHFAALVMGHVSSSRIHGNGIYMRISFRFTQAEFACCKERCRSEYDKKAGMLLLKGFQHSLAQLILHDVVGMNLSAQGLLDRLTRLFYGSMLRWLRAVFGLPLWAPSTLKEAAWLK